MPELVVDFSDVQTFAPIPVDWYDIEVTDAQLGTSQAGNAKVTLRLKVLNGEYEGRTLISDLVLEGDGRWKTKQAFEALLGEAEGQVSVSTEDLIGGVANVRVTQRLWKEEDGGDGTMRNNVSTWRAGEGNAELAGMFSDEPGPEPEKQHRGPFSRGR